MHRRHPQGPRRPGEPERRTCAHEREPHGRVGRGVRRVPSASSLDSTGTGTSARPHAGASRCYSTSLPARGRSGSRWRAPRSAASPARSEQQGDGDDPFERAPEDTLSDRYVDLAAGGMVSMTSKPESDEVRKKMITRAMPTLEVRTLLETSVASLKCILYSAGFKEGRLPCHADAHWYHSRSPTNSSISSTELPGRPPCPTLWSSGPA